MAEPAGAGGVFRFGEYEVDVRKRELRRRGEPIAVQPQTFSLLVFLIERRDRAVSKQELMDALWPDAVVTESSLQRTVSLARTALKHHPEPPIRTVARHGYRFSAAIDVPAATPNGSETTFSPRYAKNGDVHVAYHVSGSGALDVALVLGWSFPMTALFGRPETKALLEQLRGLGRLVLFDKRGTGLSDRSKALPSLEERVDDLRAVLDRIRSERAILVGISEGGALGLKFAMTHPSRIRGLVLTGAFARMAASPDYPFGWASEQIEALRAYIRRGWGTGATIRPLLAGLPPDPQLQAWAASVEQQGATPGAALELLEMNLQIDLRPLLGSVRAPTVVLQSTGDPISRMENGRFLAANIPGARYVEFSGREHTFLLGGTGVLLAEVRRLIEAASIDQPEGVLTAVLWIESAQAEGVLARLAPRFAGATAGRPDAALFDSPSRAVACAIALRDEVPHVRAGIHTTEIARSLGEATELDRTFARQLAQGAKAGEILLSRVAADMLSPGRYHLESRRSIEDPAAGRSWSVRSVRPMSSEN